MEVLFSASYFANYINSFLKCFSLASVVVFCVQKAYCSSHISRFIRRFLLLPHYCVLKALKHCLSSDWHSENLILYDRCSLILKLVWSIFSGSVSQCLYFNARILT
jgi:hypothetical protein